VSVGLLLLLAPVQKFAGAVAIATPALALSVWALFAAFTAGARVSVRRAAVAGLLLGLAGATKLAFVYFAPITLLALLYPRAPDDNRSARRRRVAAWAGAALLPLLAGLAASGGSGGLAQLFGPHLAALGMFERQAAAARRFMLLSPGFPALYLAAALAIGLLVVRQRRARVLALWLGTVALWMLTYRPLWSHHLPDLLVPLAVALGAGAVAWARLARGLARERRWPKAGLAAVVPLAPLLLGLAAHVRSYDGWRFYYDNASVAELTRVAEVIAAASAPEQFVLVDRPMIAFLARRRVPPSLAMISRKRLAVGGLTDREVVRALRDYRPAAVALCSGAFDRFQRFRTALAREYAETRTLTVKMELTGVPQTCRIYLPSALRSGLNRAPAAAWPSLSPSGAPSTSRKPRRL
jgi:hypothetical protein